MNSNRKVYAENLLFALNILVLFLVVFEEKLIIPTWLRPLGRMHPLLLHFPLVLLLLAMALEFFRFKTRFRTQEFYQIITARLLLSGIILSAVTILMGLFLAQEEGYSGSALQWHKWLGVSLLFLTSLIYISRHATWYTDRAAKAGALLTTFSLIFVGHYGAILTHGENFILEPITVAEIPAVPLDQAVVFDHAVLPLLEKKCVGCHNTQKLKGQLILDDAESMRKGGKTGKLFTAGQPELSLLLQRIYLPLDNKKHMPPRGKAQLTPEEISLLHLWIKADADFKKKIVDLPPKDSLRLIAATFINPAPENVYEFAAADGETVQKLNNNYRLVAPLAEGSPALAVSIYNQQSYNPNSLVELKEVKEQIVSLNLNKIPVKDADLKNIRQFQNLQKLNLNFTDITGQGLAELVSLKNLQYLSLSGTRINYQDLQGKIGAFKNLKTLTLWKTDLSPVEINQLQQAQPHIRLVAGFRDDGLEPIKLNPPQVKNKSQVFRETMPLQLYHPIKNAVIRYTTDGTEPDSLHSPVFKPGLELAGMTTLKTKAYKPGWLGSKVAEFKFYRSAFKPDSVRLIYPLNRVHQASGSRTFFDGELGGHNANSPAWANNWAGFYGNNMELIAEFKHPVMLSAVAFNILVESQNNLFPPAVVEVWGGPAKDQLLLMTTLKPGLPLKAGKPEIKLFEGKFKAQPVSYLRLIVQPVKKIPTWHKNKGKPALLLIDEIFLN